MVLNKVWFFFNSVFGLCFGITIFQVMVQSRPFRMVDISRASTFNAVVVAMFSGLVFFGGIMLLSLLYAKARPVPGEISVKLILLRVFAGTIIGGIVGATCYVAFLGDLAVLFLDYHGIVLYFTGAVGGCVGACIGVISSTHGIHWGIRIVVILGTGLGGVVLGFILGFLFITLFTVPFIK